ncbi:hypothetical protein B9Z51_08805 [Limnohabitans sp. T6-5]|uniref:hypothetical protein n=1 Tax=Limnohabitans sp. T6-5 TaxID=1100724 RepID=UPI000D3AEC01|nr:hypothetical protein [Limnohabitans sp. T6-5]PUE09020.1 hypothetical protein B9Z51_08805 [Limnohabitans sp. T6-5]
MSTQIEALKLALEALTIARGQLKSWGLGDEAITAIKEALAQPEQEPVAELLKQSRANFERNFGKGGQGWADWIYGDIAELLSEHTFPQPAQDGALTSEGTKAPVQQESVSFLANGTRFKMSFFDCAAPEGDEHGETDVGTYVTCFEAFAKELDGRWVALVAAEDDCHLKLTSPQPTQQEPVADRAFLGRVLAAMEGVVDVADRKTVEFDALRSCIVDLTLMLHSPQPAPAPGYCPHCKQYSIAEPLPSLPFGVGGGLVAIKTLLGRDPCAHAQTAIEMIDAILAGLPEQPTPLTPVDGDLLPPVGAKVLIHLASLDKWVTHTVVGYYVWGAFDSDQLHRVFVRVRDSDGFLNARRLGDVRLYDEAANGIKDHPNHQN